MVKRRSNFYGLKLSGMTEITKFTYCKTCSQSKNWKSLLPFFEKNNTFEITNMVEGIFIDVLHSLEQRFNFTTKLYIRKDRKWGAPEAFPNGTIAVDGMIQNLMEGNQLIIYYFN